MNCYIVQIIRLLIAPQHKLSCSWFLWRKLCRNLRYRGKNRSQESGAFLLGQRENGRTRIVDFVLYDDLDPHCLDSGIVRFNGRYFGDLWSICKDRGLTVIADIHVHPDGAGQSNSDRAHPMIAREGHLALILPNFAEPPHNAATAGIYQYQGGKDWHSIPERNKRSFFHIGI